MWVRRAALTTLACLLAAAPAYGEFPYPSAGDDPRDHTRYRVGPGGTSSEVRNNSTTRWIFAASPEPGNEPVNSDPSELQGVRGAHVADPDHTRSTAWQTTTGRPDVTIATLDSGIMWNDRSAMVDLRRKTRLNRDELPLPEGCERHDCNDDGVFNVDDYAGDSRVSTDSSAKGGVGPTDLLDPQDVLIAFSNGDDADRNGYVDDIVGWDFLDDDNDPFDDVQYGHGTGEAEDAAGEADNGGAVSACPNCMVIHMRVGDSFIADENRFAQAVIYAVDNDVLVVQEALGTLNHTRLAREAVEYAYEHGVTIIASAADEAAQHHNWPSSNPHVILVNSVTKYDSTAGFTEQPRSYLKFNGCTNFFSKLTLAVPSTSCSSDAVGRSSGMAGLVYSAALNARELGRLRDHPSCRRPDGSRCAISANEVRQVMASGTIAGTRLADDVDFLADPEESCVARTPGCTDPNPPHRPFLPQHSEPFTLGLLEPTRRYPAGFGHDQFYGWGRVNLDKAVKALQPTEGVSRVPPEAEILSPDWYTQIDPARESFPVTGQVGARDRTYSCRVYVAPGSYPNDRTAPLGDFHELPSPVCGGEPRERPFTGVLATVDVRHLKRLFPPDAGNFTGRETGTTGVQTSNGRPNTEPYGFVFKVVVETGSGTELMTGEDRRNWYLHRDRDLLDGWPLQLPSDGESSPLFVDLDGDNRNELVLGTADGFVHAYRRDGSELRGWPVRGDRPALHTGGRAFWTRAVTRDIGGPMLAAAAAGDLDRDGAPEIVAADLEGKVYAWNAEGERVFEREANPAWSGRPLAPFRNERLGERNRTQHGFIASPVLADLDADDGGRLEIVAAGMDRHIYAWNDDGTSVAGFPALVVDEDKVESIDPDSHQVHFDDPKAGPSLQQGAIIDTPAVGDVLGGPEPEIVLGTNEEYRVDTRDEGGLNAGRFNTASVALLASTGQFSPGNSRLFLLQPTGDGDGDLVADRVWRLKVGKIITELLPIVGEGITGSPVIAEIECRGKRRPAVGVVPDAGIGYVVAAKNGESCFGREDGKDIGLQTDVAVGPAAADSPRFPAVGHPAFGHFAGGVSFLAPVAGLRRALDLALNEYQGGQDGVGVWEPGSSRGQFRPNFPVQVNDLQFLTGPSVGDIDPASPGEEMVAGTAHLDLAAFSGTGTPVNSRWPKLTSDWTVANPLIGSFGTLDTGPDARQVVVGLTRSGSILAYRTDAPACSPSSWPRFHHDNANSGDFRRDAVAPGRPTDLELTGSTLKLTAPGDDLLCGRAKRYELATSRSTIERFDDARRVGGNFTPGAAGSVDELKLPAGLEEHVAVRAVDEQENVGRFAVARVPAAERR